ncbi:hypothetical protein OMQ_00596 [Enterococcus saccharolyticus subsp. saccharolyticus ATCC 43076]|uniref:EamA domain-containing protein n=2 Tax=Enterococcus saccharolyticus TaxID=41997 RepID=S0NG93_9ENTE|nr:hypothetical protein OMQ_00596 [Enterococcus saccharolyticus subsp. saccharolyticus ATCC 43076]EOT80452.1 hypothetical protein I572_00978 [Enterococcus saccharolyticus subsp. saccharolyticus ATCC 43076]OJG89991.1 hypothetical protein RV16_GL001801 [Enterococcus saccharolyticus]
MWVIYAFLSAFFAGIMSILAKIGINHVDSNLATAIRTCIVALLSWAIVFLVHSHNLLSTISWHSMWFLILSGIATGASWLCYFKALQIGDVNKVVPVDKSSVLLTMILSLIFLGESLSFLKIIAMILIGLGTYFMIERKKNTQQATTNHWFFYASLSAIFASLTAILSKIGIENVESTLGTAIRTLVILVISWGIVIVQKKHTHLKTITPRNWLFLVLSGLATGFSWLCYYKALQSGPASIVVPIDKLSIVVTVIFSTAILHETMQKKAMIGLIFLVGGTLLLLV